MISAGLDSAFLMDDWFETGVDEADVRSRLSRLSEILTRAGYDMAVDKFGFGQLMVFLGILIDTTTMTCRIDKTQAAALKAGDKLQVKIIKVDVEGMKIGVSAKM